MNTRFALSLVVGKFSPLHRGHEHVIEEALAASEKVLVLGYSKPEMPGCESQRRRAWINRRFPMVLNFQIDDSDVRKLCGARAVQWHAMPENSATDETHQVWLAWLLDEPMGMRPDALFGSEQYLYPMCERLTSLWGKPVTPMLVDHERRSHPCIASQIRADVHAHREWLHPDVYRDFPLRIALLGAESTGKSTLARVLAESFGTLWVPEYGRERWEERQGRLTLADLEFIARTQIEREDELLKQADGFLFCDTSPLTTLGYAEWMFGAQPNSLLALATRRYDVLLLCEPDFGFVQDGTRQSREFQLQQQTWYERQLEKRSERILRLRGTLKQREMQARSLLHPMRDLPADIRDIQPPSQ